MSCFGIDHDDAHPSEKAPGSNGASGAHEADNGNVRRSRSVDHECHENHGHRRKHVRGANSGRVTDSQSHEIVDGGTMNAGSPRDGKVETVAIDERAAVPDSALAAA